MKELNLDPNRIAEIMESLVNDKGFTLPILWVAIGVNSSMMGGRYEIDQGENLTFIPLIEYCPSGIVQLPVNMMFVDVQGRAARILFKGPDEVEYFN